MSSDYENIMNLLARVEITWDEGDWEGQAACLTEDIRYSLCQPDGTLKTMLEGKEAWVTAASEGMRHMQAIQHMTMTHHIEVDGDAATVVFNRLTVHVPKTADDGDLPTVRYVGSRPTWKLRRTAEGWRCQAYIANPLWQDPWRDNVSTGTPVTGTYPGQQSR